MFASPSLSLQQNLLLGLGGSTGTPGLDISPTESLGRRLASAASPSAAQSPGLNLSHHHQEDDASLSPAFAASSLLDIKDVISGNNGKFGLFISSLFELLLAHWLRALVYQAKHFAVCLFCLCYRTCSVLVAISNPTPWIKGREREREASVLHSTLLHTRVPLL